MIKSSQPAPELALADRTRFVLPAEKWRQFNAALDSAPREFPALRKLFAGDSVFDRNFRAEGSGRGCYGMLCDERGPPPISLVSEAVLVHAKDERAAAFY